MAKSIFDIIGPVMVGPSSSHTLGAVRLASFVRQFAYCPIDDVIITLYGSFALTYAGHRTDLAIIGGLLGMNYDDEELIHAFERAEEAHFSYRFIVDAEADYSANVAGFSLLLADGSRPNIIGESVGGGLINIIEIGEMRVDITGEYTSLITTHRDIVGMVAAITTVLAENRINIALLKLYREDRFENAILVAQTDDLIHPNVLTKIQKLKGIISAIIVKPIV